MKIRKGLLSSIAGLATMAALALPSAAAFAADGPGHGGGGGGSGGGGGGGTETTVTNNLSVPTVFIGAAGFGLSNPALQPPTDTPSTGYEVAGYYYVQGQNKWQAEYVVQTTDTATAKWGDNLAGGSASLRAGHPIRVEMSLTSNDVTTLQGYPVIKLQPSLLDRNSAYGTLATQSADSSYSATAAAMPARVWVAGAQLTITGPNGSTTAAMPGEINATGAVVFGYNWRPTEPGTYQLQFHVPEGSVTFSNPANTVLSVTVSSRAGGGGGGRG